LEQNRATCALFETDRFRRHVETAYSTMWQRWLRGEAPSMIDVAPI
jgi:predicted O-linked N-acetylglucosamine transferase (SPINDLY family)